MTTNELPARSQFSALNHFVPRATLRRFASREGHVYEYLTLVSHKTVLEWREVAISRAAAQDHLYTNSDIEGVATDEIEHWFNNEFETPAQEVITRIEAAISLSRDDWRKLARYFALQHLRTPTHYVKTKQRFASLHEEVLRDMAANIKERIQHHAISGGRHVVYAPDDFPMRVILDCDAATGKCSAHSQIVSGRKMWLWGIRQGLRPGGPLDALEDHKWTVLRAPDGHCWFTSDNPAVRIGFRGDGSRHLEGGWNTYGTVFLLPLSNRHLLYAQVGHKRPEKYTQLPFTAYTNLCKDLALSASRAIYSSSPNLIASQTRPREINPDQFRTEQIQWKEWNEGQALADRFEVDGLF